MPKANHATEYTTHTCSNVHGLRLTLSCIFTPAPYFSSSCMMSLQPHLAARIRGVFPFCVVGQGRTLSPPRGTTQVHHVHFKHTHISLYIHICSMFQQSLCHIEFAFPAGPAQRSPTFLYHKVKVRSECSSQCCVYCIIQSNPASCAPLIHVEVLNRVWVWTYFAAEMVTKSQT